MSQVDSGGVTRELECTDCGAGISCIDANYMRAGIACFYLLQRGDECAVIDTGTHRSVASLRALMTRRGLRPEQVRYVIPTHVHLDHAGGAGAMMALFPDAQLLIHPSGARHLIDPARLVESATRVYGAARFRELYGDILPVDAARVRAVADGERVNLGGHPLQLRHTPGHADHHLCIWDEASRGWFSGDMFGVSYPWFRFDAGDYVIPSTTPSQFRPQAYLASLELLHSYRPTRMFLTHFGELSYSTQRMQLLADQVASYPEIARTSAATGSSLEQALAAYSLQRAREYAPDAVDDATLARQLAFDVGLNAQGLQIWLERHPA